MIRFLDRGSGSRSDPRVQSPEVQSPESHTRTCTKQQHTQQEKLVNNFENAHSAHFCRHAV